MDLMTLIISVLSSLGISMAGAWWLSKKLISHKLSKDLEDYKANWKRTLESEKLKLSGNIRKELEINLGDLSAKREYELEAKKRLYQLIGPLKFQLLIACRDAAHRIEGHSTTNNYKTNTSNYYGTNTMYRVLRPLAVAELIEQQISYADFSVDTSAIRTLLFKKSAVLTLSGGAVICQHPNADWDNQVEHLFYDSIHEAAHSLIVSDNNQQQKIMSYHEFNSMFTANQNNSALKALAYIFDNFTVSNKPLFWIRLISFGHICREYVGTEGAELNFQYSKFNLSNMIEQTEDEIILDNISKYKKAINKSLLTKL